MKRISPERKTSVLAKLLLPYNMTVAAVAQMEGISEATLYNWRNQAKSEGKPVPGAEKNSEQWPAEARLAVIVETATLSETEIAEYITPLQRHTGEDKVLLAQRDKVYQAARARNPIRWPGQTRNWQRRASVTLNPEREK